MGSIAMVTDQTERMRVEQKVEDSECRLADIINSLPDPTFVIDKEGMVTAWNRAMERLTGIKADDMLDKGDYEYALPFFGTRRPILVDLVLRPDEQTEKLYEKLHREGETLAAEVYIPSFKPGGAYFWSKASPLYDAEGKPIGAMESMRDVTDQRLAERKLQESEARFRQLAENALDVITRFEFVPEPRMTYISSAITQMGYTPEEYYADPELGSKLIHPDDRPLLGSLARGEMLGKPIILRWLRKDGTYVWTEQRTVPVFDETGRLDRKSVV